MFCSGLPPKIAQDVLNELALQIQEQPISHPDELVKPEFKIKGLNQTGRVDFKVVPFKKAYEAIPMLTDQFVRPITPEMELWVLLSPDSNNVLPGEPRYDESCRQITFED